MGSLRLSRTSDLRSQVLWWFFFGVCALNALYALYLGMAEVLSWAGLLQDVKPRAVPPVFVVHALAGAIALISGALNFNRRILKHSRKTHRVLGLAYVGSIWASSLAGLWSAVFFEVPMLSRIVLGLLAVLWVATTTIAFSQARNHKFAAHREWMIRSFALTFFFVTAGFWMPVLASSSLPESISHPLSLFLGWVPNLIVAELIIRRTRLHTAESLAKDLFQGQASR